MDIYHIVLIHLMVDYSSFPPKNESIRQNNRIAFYVRTKRWIPPYEDRWIELSLILFSFSTAETSFTAAVRSTSFHMLTRE